ncbi:pyrroline-5-carboxylate reductase [Methylopila sp. 73B]|uniref:pyrroline-5-carboxylate reductase n=1 Tax=Methylopila sp. 73B TaxID=1120792 RepID=UPI0003666FA6|nr:pyrroline-5-carboxylate reductase [Methylopila sp. 73B]
MTDHSIGPLSSGGPILLVGAGKMGGALLDGWLAGGLDPALVAVVDPGLPTAAAERLAAQGVVLAPEPGSLPPPAAILFAVKPQMATAALPSVAGFIGPDTVVVSILAGTTLRTLRSGLPDGAAVVRTMPNTPASVGRGITACVAGEGVNARQRALADRLLQTCGEVVWVDDEALIDAVTGVSGSGPAYVFLMAESLARAGVAAGLSPELAGKLARATIEGAGELLHRSPETPETLRKNVTSPNGTTAAALGVLMAADGLDPLLERAVAAATARSRELAG